MWGAVLPPLRVEVVQERLDVAKKLERPVRSMSAVFLLLIIALTVLKERANIGEYFRQVGVAALAFNLASMAVGFLVPRAVRLSKRQSIAIAMEIGIHNGTLAIAIASSPLLLNNGVMAIPPAIYSLIMFFTAAAFGFLIHRRVEEPLPEAAEA